MSASQPEALLRVSSFEVLIGDREIGIAEISRLTSEAGPIPPPDGPRALRPSTIILRRALTTSTELYDWHRHIVDGSDDRRDVMIRQLSGPAGDVVNAWRLVRAWPCRWSGPAFDALSDGVAFEELELVFADLQWVDHGPPITGG